MDKIVIIVAGGRGTRMKSAIPKQFIDLNGVPVIVHTLLNFRACSPAYRFIIALASGLEEEFRALAKRHCPSLQYQLSQGGDTRFHTVKNALEKLEGPGLVAVHDAVRPLVQHAVINSCFDAAASYGAAIPVIEVNESLRSISPAGSIAEDRSRFRMVQTPQVFDSHILLKAFSQKYSPLFTDDASVVEAAGYAIQLVDGNQENIKITTSEDLALACYYMQKKQAGM